MASIIIRLSSPGVVESVGGGVTGFAPGDRVATFGPVLGAYATERNLPAALLFELPDDVNDELAAAVLLKGCTVEFLVERCAKVQPGWTVVVHAAAGGVGLLLVQWLKAVGATVIGTVSTDEKAQIAREAGADHVVLTSDDLVEQVAALTGGAKAQVVYDGIGRDTFAASLDSLAKRGLLVSYGNASGKVGEVDFGILAMKGSLFTTRPTLFDYYAAPDERAAGAERLWPMIRSGKLEVTIGQRYALEDTAQAHADIEARKTSGSTILLP